MSEQPTLYELSGLSPEDLAQVLSSNPRAYMAVKGAVAEKHLDIFLQSMVEQNLIAQYRLGEGDFEKDFYITLRDGTEKIIECKNVQVISISGFSTKNLCDNFL